MTDGPAAGGTSLAGAASITPKEDPSRNEDACVVVLRTAGGGRGVVVADGVGSYARGGDAAWVAARTAAAEMEGVAAEPAGLRRVFRAAHDRLRRHAVEQAMGGDPVPQSFGTTLIVALEAPDALLVGYTGNGAIWHLRGNFLEFPDSAALVWGAVNYLSPHSVPVDGRELLYRIVDASTPFTEPTLFAVSRDSSFGDILVICTDGIYSADQVVQGSSGDGQVWTRTEPSLAALFRALREQFADGPLDDAALQATLDRYLEGQHELGLLEDDATVGVIVTSTVLDYHRMRRTAAAIASDETESAQQSALSAQAEAAAKADEIDEADETDKTDEADGADTAGSPGAADTPHEQGVRAERLIVMVRSGLSSELLPGFEDIRTLELDGPINGGGFGDIYALLSIDGAPPATPQVVKIFKESGPGSVRKGSDTIQELQHRIIEKNADRRRRGTPVIESYPALTALPQFSFEGTLDGDPVRGYTATRLDTAGYVPFSVILAPGEDSEPRKAFFTELTWPADPIALALELAEGFEVLEELSYIHADIHPPNLFINIRDCHIAMIGFDSGGVTQDPDEKPSTFGRFADAQWLAPEIWDQFTRSGPGPVEVCVDRTTDMWAVAVAIHYLLFGMGPYFFLDTVTSASLREYGQRYEWPRMDTTDPMFNPDPAMPRTHNTHGNLLAQLPGELARHLAVAFRDGALNPGRRDTHFQWANVLYDALPRVETPDEAAGGQGV